MKRNLALDGLRGYATLAVIIYHAILLMDLSLIDRVLLVPIQNIPGTYDVVTKVGLMIFNGETAVAIFFVLSGVVLFNSLINGKKGFFRLCIDFVIKRILRIYPALIICLLVLFSITLLLSKWFPTSFSPFTWSIFVKNALLTETAMHGASWTLRIEVIAIPFILLGFYVFRIGGVIGLILYMIYSILIADNPILFLTGDPAITSSLLSFSMGFIISTKLGEQIFTHFNKKGIPFIVICMILVRHIVPHAPNTALIAHSVFASMLVGMIYYSKAGNTGRFLENKFSAYLGSISYSLYLFNVIFLNIVCIFMLKMIPQASKHPLEFGLLASGIIIVLSIPVSHLSEKYIERSSIWLGKKLTAITFNSTSVAKKMQRSNI
ncbi:acyltransferase family protein [Paenibacillus sp. GCM10012303]|uniref:acyltransferase family protein n=1 Tax=Paenibacillus sp. GCM10012303 TaxID=3317340 RepID=UPI00360C2CE8